MKGILALLGFVIMAGSMGYAEMVPESSFLELIVKAGIGAALTMPLLLSDDRL